MPDRRPLCFIDTETTGLDPNKHEVIELAIIREEVPLYPWVRPMFDVWTTRIKPERIEDAEEKALEVNGYKAHPELWVDAPLLRDVVPRLIEMFKEGIPTGHNVGFDTAMLNGNLARIGPERVPDHYKLDTITLAYEHLTPLGLKSLKLDRIREFLGWPKDRAHTALGDVEDTRRLFHLLRGGLPMHERLKIFLRSRLRLRTS